MGMTSDQNENISFAEQREIAKREAASAALRRNTPEYSSLGIFTLLGKKYLLLVGCEDKKWYKSEFIREERVDELNCSPLRSIFSNEITPVTEEEFYSYFPRPKEA